MVMEKLNLSDGELKLVLDYLRKMPDDFTGAAKLLGVSRGALVEYAERFSEPFDELREEYVDTLAAYCQVYARGGELPVGVAENFNFEKAWKVIQTLRPQVYGASVKVRSEAKREAQARVDARRKPGLDYHHEDPMFERVSNYLKLLHGAVPEVEEGDGEFTGDVGRLLDDSKAKH